MITHSPPATGGVQRDRPLPDRPRQEHSAAKAARINAVPTATLLSLIMTRIRTIDIAPYPPMNTQSTIENKLNALNPQFLRVENESHRHNVPEGSESHFKVTVVSRQFNDKTRLARHRLINEILALELSQHVHALALHLMTPDEWADNNGATADSPPCLGGSAAEKQ